MIANIYKNMKDSAKAVLESYLKVTTALTTCIKDEKSFKIKETKF